ncbi:carboxypeptidase-like regulatory domain-containing protein [Marivirga salinae]|uniref:Carboxypeptidase-like regulatory domain-containing protein n=1 Tax=Marivirga salinarum TaxID=3059078 RepID=A0AA51ND72_9BACT|nr:carboxypeptidase-like regulatory domain-containing protein [Marivirga sp. BDSF4-3]WMN12980.1 carboxypeptidase-like regulatory domain-containing protein [Marivirga sp. BDSF4-3]
MITSFLAFSQKHHTIKGQLLQHSDSSPVFNAHIYFDKTAIGTTTNEDGLFAFHFLENEKQSNIHISCIGYKIDSIPISEFQNKPLTIFIEEDKLFLSEVVVSPSDPNDILEKAIENLGQNYPKEKISKTIYYKESVKQNGKPIRLLEVVATIVSDGFSDSRQNPKKYELFIDQKRPDFNYDSTFEGGNGIGVLHGLLWTEAYLNKRKLRKYNVSFDGKSFFRNHEVYKISISKPNSLGTTSMYITVDEFAIVAISQSFVNPSRKKPDSKQQFQFLAFDLYVDFIQMKDGYWYIHTIDDIRESISQDGAITKIIRSIRTTSVGEIQDLNKKNRIKMNTDLYKYPTEYDPEFWNHYNAPLETQEELKAKQEFSE